MTYDLFFMQEITFPYNISKNKVKVKLLRANYNKDSIALFIFNES